IFLLAEYGFRYSRKIGQNESLQGFKGGDFFERVFQKNTTCPLRIFKRWHESKTATCRGGRGTAFLFLFSLKKKKGQRVVQVVAYHLIRHICQQGFSVADHVTKLVWYNVLYQNRIWLSPCDMMSVRNGGGLSMAHVQNFSRGAVGGLSSNSGRKTENHSHTDIDTARSHENY